MDSVLPASSVCAPSSKPTARQLPQIIHFIQYLSLYPHLALRLASVPIACHEKQPSWLVLPSTKVTCIGTTTLPVVLFPTRLPQSPNAPRLRSVKRRGYSSTVSITIQTVRLWVLLRDHGYGLHPSERRTCPDSHLLPHTIAWL